MVKSCPNQTANRAQCSCTYEPCSRKGFCCECLHHHRKQGQLPACYFPAEVEATYDRSIRAFLKTQGR